MTTILRKAQLDELLQIWTLLEGAIQRRKAEGSQQWQDGYPNPTVVQNDIENGHAYVLCENDEIVGYCAILINNEPAYEVIEGEWLSQGDYVVYHRVAIAEGFLGKGFAKQLLFHIEEFAKQHQIRSVRADTNFDNIGMLTLFGKLGYQYCGEVYFRGSNRKAFEKLV